MVGHERAVHCEETEQVGHLLQVRWHIRVVSSEMDVVELNINDVLDVSMG